MQADFKKHIAMLITMKQNLDSIYKRIRFVIIYLFGYYASYPSDLSFFYLLL